jgi:hypothetical protein
MIRRRIARLADRLIVHDTEAGKVLRMNRNGSSSPSRSNAKWISCRMSAKSVGGSTRYRTYWTPATGTHATPSRLVSTARRESTCGGNACGSSSSTGSRPVAGRRPVAYANTIAAAALVLALAYVTFEIRRIYHGPAIAAGPTSGAEQYTYSIAYLAFGVVLLGIGILFNSQRARLASAVVIGLTILKAFLIDMSALTGVYRALSFMCLGLVLVAIGWLYQRILFRRQAAAPT